MAETPVYPGIPKWVKVSGVAGIVILLVLMMVVAGDGRHGPARHLTSIETEGGASRFGIAEDTSEGSVAPKRVRP